MSYFSERRNRARQASQARLTTHARQQIQKRPVVSDREVLAAVASKASEIAETDAYEVRVIVKTLPEKVYFPDGSNGDTVLACVDPDTMNIKTVMLQRSSQVERKRLEGDADYL